MECNVIDLGDLSPAFESVKLGGEEYELREATADGAHAYRQAFLAGGKLDKDDTILLAPVRPDFESVLVAKSLFRKGGAAPVFTVDEVKVWPDRIKERLFNEAKKLNPHMFGGAALPNSNSAGAPTSP